MATDALPAGTYRVLQTAQARLTFEHGDRVGACRILRDNIESDPAGFAPTDSPIQDDGIAAQDGHLTVRWFAGGA